MDTGRRLVAFGCLLGLSTTALAGSLGPHLIDRLSARPDNGWIPVLIEFSGNAALDELADLPPAQRRTALVKRLRKAADNSQRDVREALQAYRPVILWHINALAATVPARTVHALTHLPEVRRITLDRAVTLAGGSLTPSDAGDWNLQAIGVDRLWAAGIDGSGVTVAILDTGVDPAHPDLGPGWRGQTGDWFDAAGEYAVPHDGNGHGTQVLGLVLGGQSRGTPIGAAPGAQWIAGRIFHDDGTGTLSGIHQGFQWLLDPDGDPGSDDAPDVVVNAWSLLDSVGACNREFEPDIELLVLADIAVAFPAGNSGPYSDTSTSPGNYAASFSAGATDIDNGAADFSGRGPSACTGTIFPHLAAPGVQVTTTDLTFGGVFPDSYVGVTGTSFAAAHVAGGLALLRSAYPSAGTAQIKAALVNTAHDLPPQGADHATGAGLTDLEAALQYLAETVGVDADGDGYVHDIDCNDADPATHPDAPEVVGDGIDQDCNGYDLTIRVHQATYSDRQDTLTVSASSTLGRDAALEVADHGPMKWQRKANRWELTIRHIEGAPSSITVLGIEGAVTAPVTMQ